MPFLVLTGLIILGVYVYRKIVLWRQVQEANRPSPRKKKPKKKKKKQEYPVNKDTGEVQLEFERVRTMEAVTSAGTFTVNFD